MAIDYAPSSPLHLCVSSLITGCFHISVVIFYGLLTSSFTLTQISFSFQSLLLTDSPTILNIKSHNILGKTIIIIIIYTNFIELHNINTYTPPPLNLFEYLKLQDNDPFPLAELYPPYLLFSFY